MATVDSLKTWQPSCSAQVFQTHTNWQPGNTLIKSLVLPIIKFWTSLHKSYKKRTGMRLWLSDRAHPSTSSQRWSSSGKSVPIVARQTTPCRIIGPEGRIWIKKAKDKRSPNCQIHPEKNKQTKRGRAKKGTCECQCIICTRFGWFVHTNGTINWFFMLWNEWESGMVLG